MGIAVVLAVAWGVLAAAPVARRARRVPAAARVASLTGSRVRARRRAPLVGRLAARPAGVFARATGPVGPVVRGLAGRRRRRRAEACLAHDLPAAVDLLVVAVGSGQTPFGAIELAAAWTPPTVARPLERVLAEHRLGRSLQDALADLAHVPLWKPVADALAAGDRLGAPVAPALARVAEGLRRDLRRRAEAHARTVPVKLLFPLVFLVLPAFALLTVVPALVQATRRL